MLSPPAPNHAQSFGRLSTSQESVPATPNNPMTNLVQIDKQQREYYPLGTLDQIVVKTLVNDIRGLTQSVLKVNFSSLSK